MAHPGLQQSYADNSLHEDFHIYNFSGNLFHFHLALEVGVGYWNMNTAFIRSELVIHKLSHRKERSNLQIHTIHTISAHFHLDGGFYSAAHYFNRKFSEWYVTKAKLFLRETILPHPTPFVLMSTCNTY